MSFKEIKKKRNKRDLLITLGCIILYIITFIIFSHRESNRYLGLYMLWLIQINCIATYLHALAYEYFVSDIQFILREELVVTNLRMKNRRSLAFNLSILCSCLVFFVCQIGSIINCGYMIFNRFEWTDLLLDAFMFIMNTINFSNIYSQTPLSTWIGVK